MIEVFRKMRRELAGRQGEPQTTWLQAIRIGEFARSGLVNIVGGCCGTTPAHIQAIADAVTGVATDRHSDPDGDVWLPMEMDTTLLSPDTCTGTSERTVVLSPNWPSSLAPQQ